MKKFKLTIHPLFVVLAVIIIYSGEFLLLLSYIVVVLLHELAHAVVAFKLGYKLNKLTLMPYGAGISGTVQDFIGNDEIKIASAGPIFNIILGVLTIALWWMWPESFEYTQVFAAANFVTAVINLFPVFPLDGGRALLCVLSKKMHRKKAHRILKILGLAISAGLIAVFFVTTFFTANYTILCMGAFLFVSVILETPQSFYTRNLFSVKKQSTLLSGMKVGQVAVSESTPVYKLLPFVNNNSLTEFKVYSRENKLIGVLTEFQLHKLALNAALNSPVGQFLSSPNKKQLE